MKTTPVRTKVSKFGVLIFTATITFLQNAALFPDTQGTTTILHTNQMEKMIIRISPFVIGTYKVDTTYMHLLKMGLQTAQWNVFHILYVESNKNGAFIMRKQ